MEDYVCERTTNIHLLQVALMKEGLFHVRLYAVVSAAHRWFILFVGVIVWRTIITTNDFPPKQRLAVTVWYKYQHATRSSTATQRLIVLHKFELAY